MGDYERKLNSEDSDSAERLSGFSFINHIPRYGSSFSPQKLSLRISSIYIMIGCLWILFSDRILNILVSDKDKITLISMIKGWFFVIASGVVIYILIFYTLKRVRKAEKIVVDSYNELTATYEELEASHEEITASEEEIKQQFDELQVYSNINKESEDRLNRAQALAKVGNWELDTQRNTIWASEEAFRLYGINHETNILPLAEAHLAIHEDDRDKMDLALKLLLEKNEKYDMEFRVIKVNDNTERIMHSIAEIEFNQSGKPEKVLGVIQDITESMKNQETIKHLAYYDKLTDLPNRVLFIDRLKDAIDTAKMTNTKIAVVFFDIDNFKKVNDLFGHYAGDKLLIDISTKLKLSLQEHETLARFSGDEFTIFIENIAKTEEIIVFIDRIKKTFDNSFSADKHAINISSSFGISIFPDHGESVEELLKNADLAMYKAKEIGRNNYKFYDDKMRDEFLLKLQIEKHLSTALERNELYLCYQPQVDIKSYKIRGLEALLRWRSADIGIISPYEFIPIAEESGLIISIGEWVLEKSCEMNRLWQENYNFFAIISVNISPVQFKQINFVEKVKFILDKTGLKPEYLELEITENVLIDSFDIVDILWELKKFGVKISLDDFGTGFSSLNYLSKLPLNTLKIDKEFVKNIRHNSKEKTVTESIISLVHKLELEVVAEGVETIEQLEFLKKSNSDNVQGFLFSKPLIESELIDIIKKGEITIN